MKQIVRVTTLSLKDFDDDWPPADALGALAWWGQKINEVPEEQRMTAQVEIDSEPGYGDLHYARITISYYRLETDEEEARRVSVEQSQKLLVQQRELAEFSRLSAKYAS